MEYKFLKLTELLDLGEVQNKIYINIDNISSMYKAANDNTTFIKMNNGDRHLVIEPINTIMTRLKNNGAPYLEA